jgi:hypothetical protein
VIDWVLEITGIFPIPLANIAPLYVQVPVSAGSVRGGGAVATVVGTGVGTVVAGGTGVGDEQPATRIPTNRTAQTKNSKDFIFTEYPHLLFIPIPTFRFRAGNCIIFHEISIQKKRSVIVIFFSG